MIDKRCSFYCGLPFDEKVFHDCSIPLRRESTIDAFNLPKVEISAVKTSSYELSVDKGSSINCDLIKTICHAQATHTECIGHISKDKIYISQVCQQLSPLTCCAVMEIEPSTVDYIHPSEVPKNYKKSDRLITKEQVESCYKHLFDHADTVESYFDAVAIKTRKSEDSLSFSNTNPPYFTAGAISFLSEKNVHHLLVDLPSVDKEDDGGELIAHKGMFQNAKNTITELCDFTDVKQGLYVLNLQIILIESDATFSRPILMPILKREDC